MPQVQMRVTQTNYIAGNPAKGKILAEVDNAQVKGSLEVEASVVGTLNQCAVGDLILVEFARV